MPDELDLSHTLYRAAGSFVKINFTKSHRKSPTHLWSSPLAADCHVWWWNAGLNPKMIWLLRRISQPIANCSVRFDALSAFAPSCLHRISFPHVCILLGSLPTAFPVTIISILPPYLTLPICAFLWNKVWLHFSFIQIYLSSPMYCTAPLSVNLSSMHFTHSRLARSHLKTPQHWGVFFLVGESSEESSSRGSKNPFREFSCHNKSSAILK